MIKLLGISLFVPLLNLFCLWKIRGAVRDKHSIDGSPIKDCLEVWCCGLCAAVQECKVCSLPHSINNSVQGMCYKYLGARYVL